MRSLDLYIDDSGCRNLNHPREVRSDGMDHFALGGFLIDSAEIGCIHDRHSDLLKKWGIEAPLHSTKIRGRRGAFSFLARSEAVRTEFHHDLDGLIGNVPILSMGCVIDRPGYAARYTIKHPEPWPLCRTAFAILIERACKYAQDHGAELVIYFEGAGEREDQTILSYMRDLKANGMPFPGSAAAGYEDLSPREFKSIVRGDPNRVTKAVPMIQLADLVLYALAKGGYDESYPPYRRLFEQRRVIDAVLTADMVPARGVKYSCFDTKKARAKPEPLARLA